MDTSKLLIDERKIVLIDLFEGIFFFLNLSSIIIADLNDILLLRDRGFYRNSSQPNGLVDYANCS